MVRWFPKTGDENIPWLFRPGGGACFIQLLQIYGHDLCQGEKMIENEILQCLTSFSKLLNITYNIHLGHKGKTVSFNLGFTKEDCYHLMGLHYLADRHDNRGRNYIFDELLSSESFRIHLSESEHMDENVRDRIHFTGILEQLLDDNNTVFKYNPRRLMFYSSIEAEYLLDNQTNNREIYIFLDKRNTSEEYYCRSIFPKGTRDYTDRQSTWTLLHKEKRIGGEQQIILYHHRSYTLPLTND